MCREQLHVILMEGTRCKSQSQFFRHQVFGKNCSQSFRLKLQCVSIVTHIVSEQLHDKSGNAAVDAYKDVDAGEDDIRRAGDLKKEGSRVHQRSDGPPERHQTQFN